MAHFLKCRCGSAANGLLRSLCADLAVWLVAFLLAQKLVSTLNTGRISRETEVVVAPPALYLGSVKSSLRGDIGVAAQVRNASSRGEPLWHFAARYQASFPSITHELHTICFTANSFCQILQEFARHAQMLVACGRGVPFSSCFEQSPLASEHPRSSQLTFVNVCCL